MCAAGRVAWIAGVDDDDGTSLPTELQAGCQPGRRAADDGDVAFPLDRRLGVPVFVLVLVLVCAHDLDVRDCDHKCMIACGIRKGILGQRSASTDR